MTQYVVPTSKELGALIRGLRKQRGWTQAQLAAQAGLLPKTVSAIEAGTGQVLVVNMMRCVSALDAELIVASRPGTFAPAGRGERSNRPQHTGAPGAARTDDVAPKPSRVRRTVGATKALKERW